MTRTVTIIGINGHIGHHAAKAFVSAGWTVRGMGRSNRKPIAGVEFIKGDADSVPELKHAIGDSEVVVNALNLPYHEWDKGRMEAQTARVIEAASGAGRTLLFPGNIYNYAASLRDVTPDAPQHPETPRGAIRVRVEKQLRDAAKDGDLQVIILRAGDFYGPNNTGDWFDYVMLREASKGKLAMMAAPAIGHSWAYLPDFGQAFARIAEVRGKLGQFENFHFAGHWVTSGEMTEAIRKAAPVPLKANMAPLAVLRLIGLVNPLIREIMKMRYLWENPMRLHDERLAAILGDDFGTPFEEAVAATVRPFFSATSKRAA